MEEYYFECTNQKFLTILFGSSLLMMVGIIVFAGSFVPPSVSILFIVMAILSPFFVFFLNRQKLNKQVTAYLDDASVKFDFGDHSELVAFNQLKSYQIEEFRGVTLRLNFSSNHKILLRTDSVYSDASSMRLFCNALEERISLSNKNHLSQVVRVGSIFEKGWMLWVLILGTASFAGIQISFLSKEKLFTFSFCISIACLVTLWISYFRTKQKSRTHF